MELAIYILIAIFVILRLFTILGKVDDGDGEISAGLNAEKIIDAEVEDILKGDSPGIQRDFILEGKVLEKLDSRSKTYLNKIEEIDKNFNLTTFLNGAEVAFETIFKAYVEHNLNAIKAFVSPSAMQKLSANYNIVQKNKSVIVSIKDVSINDVQLHDTTATIYLTFHSEQIRCIVDENGKVLSGNPRKKIMVVDTWALRRDVSVSDPNWTLIEIRQ